MNTETEHRFRRAAGFTLVEVSIVVGLIGILLVSALPVGRALDRWSLSRGATIVERHLAGVRLRAVAHRERLRVRVISPGTLVTLDDAGLVVDRRVLAGPGNHLLDSIRIRPATIGYNSRGHGSAGSLYLYRADRGIRVISNFVGRIRRHSFRP
ncbi:MAG: Tfp pilus assembly protein FimT/FimU [Gemmatimonadota bacterium]